MQRFFFTLFFVIFTSSLQADLALSPIDKKAHRDARESAKKLIKEGAFCEAILQYNAAEASGLTLNADENFQLAYLFFLFGNYEEAVRRLKENTNHPETLYLLALSYKELGQKDFARTSLKKYAAQKEGQYHVQAFFEQALLSSTAEEKKEHLERLVDRRDKNANTLFARGAALFEMRRCKEAAAAFQQVLDKEPNSPLAIASLYFLAESSKSAELFVKIYTNHADSPFAPLSFFALYPYDRYIQGDEIALRHLAELPSKFPEASVTILANFLLGLDFLRDQKTSSGKIIRKKDYLAAIHRFQEAETLYLTLMSRFQIPPHEIDYYHGVAQNAMMERALANREIAKTARGAKKRIYFEYALDVLKTLVEREGSTFSPQMEEGQYRLAETHYFLKNSAAAEEIALSLLEQYQKRKITRATFLSKTEALLGEIKQNEDKNEEAILYFRQADDAASGGLISDEERLTLWMQTSICLKKMGDTDGAIRLLSQIINEDVVSKIRKNAMLMRADIYRESGRTELAKKQYEAILKNEKE